MKIQDFNPILYLEDYENIPDEIYRWKQDEELHPGYGWGGRETSDSGSMEDFMPDVQAAHAAALVSALLDSSPDIIQHSVPHQLCVGIGRYHTDLDGDIYLCALLCRERRTVESCAFGVYRSAELVRKALDIFFEIYPVSAAEDISLLSSRNPIYQRPDYAKIISRYPIRSEMTAKGTRGGAAVVSTYFSQLMRRKGSTVFHTWQDAIDWLSADIIRYNQKMSNEIQ